MNVAEKRIKQLAVAMYYVAGAAIVGMMLITTIDVALRFAVTIYSKTHWAILAKLQPIPGTYELVCFLGSVAAAFAMAHTSVEEGHVSVTLIVRLLPKKTRTVFAVTTESLGILFFALVAWQSLLYAGRIRESGEVSMTMQMPVHPFVYGTAFGALAVCLVLMVSIARIIKERGSNQ